MKKILKYIIYRIAGIIVILVILYLGFIGWLQWRLSHPSAQDVFPLWGKHTTETNVLRWQVGTTRLNIPVNYIFRKPGRLRTDILKGSTTEGIWVLWPDLKPYTEETRAEFDRLGYGNKMSISIHYVEKWYRPQGKFDASKLDPHEDLSTRGVFTPEYHYYEDTYRLKQEGLEGTYQHDEQVPAEFIYYPNLKGADETKGPMNLYAVLENGHYAYSATCTGSQAAPSPACQAHFKYDEEILVSYTFHLKLLKHWRQFEPKIRALLMSFEQAAANEKIDSN